MYKAIGRNMLQKLEMVANVIRKGSESIDSNMGVVHAGKPYVRQGKAGTAAAHTSHHC